ncbi:hydrolase [Pyrenophora seminiperda CCB06]|uniref:Hydrolase n=1 Tax=Pyrenophora seminiperda CCB06 TaxID=1302712 RepID=A0A3M7LY56_9PLEO|nr:hydrolase [Pyrenophora seminiperda CCB06]
MVDLQWQPCFENFTCTRLQVPLDYADVSAGTTAIDFIKHAAPSPFTGTRDILFNPGGPGSSGVDSVLTDLETLRFFLGDAHNIVSFDPRGTGNSSSKIDCFQGDVDASNRFAAVYIPVVDADSSQSKAQVWALAGAYGDWCTASHQNDTARFVSTSAVAQDMLRYANVSHDYSDGKLWYWGVSYGTALGGTFASLYPDRVGRMILDGQLDLEDWYAGTLKSNIVDQDKLVEQFFEYCHNAGPEKCAFYADSPEKIANRTRNLIETIRQEPIGVANRAVAERPIIVTYEVMRFAFLNAMYQPTSQWPGFAKMLLDLEMRNGTSTAHLDETFHGPFQGSTVLCADANGRYNLSTPELFSQHVKVMRSQSYWTGESWLHPVECRNMHLTPPPSQQFHFPTFMANMKNNPILFVSNTLDPVTPLSGARKMQAHFSGSSLLVVDAMGHSSLSAASNCTVRYVQEYLDGKLPPAGAVCQPNKQPFED